MICRSSFLSLNFHEFSKLELALLDLMKEQEKKGCGYCLNTCTSFHALSSSLLYMYLHLYYYTVPVPGAYMLRVCVLHMSRRHPPQHPHPPLRYLEMSRSDCILLVPLCTHVLGYSFLDSLLILKYPSTYLFLHVVHTYA